MKNKIRDKSKILYIACGLIAVLMVIGYFGVNRKVTYSDDCSIYGDFWYRSGDLCVLDSPTENCTNGRNGNTCSKLQAAGYTCTLISSSSQGANYVCNRRETKPAPSTKPSGGGGFNCSNYGGMSKIECEELQKQHKNTGKCNHKGPATADCYGYDAASKPESCLSKEICNDKYGQNCVDHSTSYWNPCWEYVASPAAKKGTCYHAYSGTGSLKKLIWKWYPNGSSLKPIDYRAEDTIINISESECLSQPDGNEDNKVVNCCYENNKWVIHNNGIGNCHQVTKDECSSMNESGWKSGSCGDEKIEFYGLRSGPYICSTSQGKNIRYQCYSLTNFSSCEKTNVDPDLNTCTTGFTDNCSESQKKGICVGGMGGILLDSNNCRYTSKQKCQSKFKCIDEDTADSDKNIVITFKNGDSTVKSESCVVKKGKSRCENNIIAPGPVDGPEGKVFTGWGGSNGCTAGSYTANASFSPHVSATYYACFGSIPDKVPNDFDDKKCQYYGMYDVTRDERYKNCKYTNITYDYSNVSHSSEDYTLEKIRSCCQARGFTWVGENFTGSGYGNEYCVVCDKAIPPYDPNVPDSYVPDSSYPVPSFPSTSNPDSSVPSSSEDVPDVPKENPQTGSVAIFMVWIIAIGTLVYSLVYFKNSKFE